MYWWHGLERNNNARDKGEWTREEKGPLRVGVTLKCILESYWITE